MATPNADKAQSIGQDRPYKDAVDQCDAEKGTYDDTRSQSGKPNNPGPGPLPNTPNPFNLTQG